MSQAQPWTPDGIRAGDEVVLYRDPNPWPPLILTIVSIDDGSDPPANTTRPPDPENAGGGKP
jgi:hypothetical protein